MMIFSVSFMNEFSHLLESQNSVIITDLLLCFSQFFPFFYNLNSFPSLHKCLTCVVKTRGAVLGECWGLLLGVFKKLKHMKQYFLIGIFDFQIENIFL